MDNDLIGAILKTFAHDKDVKQAIVNYIDAATKKIESDDWIEVWRQVSDDPTIIFYAYDRLTASHNVERKVYAVSIAMFSKREKVGVIKGYVKLNDDPYWDIGYQPPLYRRSVTAMDYTDVILHAQSHWADVLQAIQDFAKQETERNGAKRNESQ